MLMDDIFHSCAHEKVAQAAVACIGGAFAERVRHVAADCGLTPGAFAAKAVRRFDRSASGDARDILRRALHGTDQPILHGLRLIVEPSLEEAAECGKAELVS
jgi:plasmid stability protein